MFARLAFVPPKQPETHAQNDQRQAEESVDLKRGHERSLRSMARPMKCRAPLTKSQPSENPTRLQPNEYPRVPLVSATTGAIAPIAMQAVEMRSSAPAENLVRSLWTRSPIASVQPDESPTKCSA